MNHTPTLSLREKIHRTDTLLYGMNIYSGSSTVVEIAGAYDLDFLFIDTEHTSMGIDERLEKLVLSSKVAGVDALVRVSGVVDAEIRKVLEFGATGVIIPRVDNADQMHRIIKASKFPGLGRRGGDSSVRSASYGAPGFDWQTYCQRENDRTVIVPMAESYEFFDNIDEILDVEGIDAVHFGPADYSLSRQLPIDYRMQHPEVREKLALLISKCRPKNIRVMVPCFPPDQAQAAELAAMGCDMLLLGSDIYWMNQAGKNIHTIRENLA